MGLDPFAEGITAGHLDGPFKVVSSLVVLAVDECGPAEMVMAPTDCIWQTKTLSAGEGSLKEWARLGTLTRKEAELAAPEIDNTHTAIIADALGERRGLLKQLLATLVIVAGEQDGLDIQGLDTRRVIGQLRSGEFRFGNDALHPDPPVGVAKPYRG